MDWSLGGGLASHKIWSKTINNFSSNPANNGHIPVAPTPQIGSLLVACCRTIMQSERVKSTMSLYATPGALEVNLVLPYTRLPMLLVKQGRLSKTFAKQTARARDRDQPRTQSGKTNRQSELFLACQPDHG